MKNLKVSQLREILKSGKEKFLIADTVGTHGQTYIVAKDNPNVVVAKVSKTILNSFDTQIYGTPKRYYEFV